MNAAVASPHWAASIVGRDVLTTGGNALDASLAMNAMLTVVYPHMCGLGGDLFLLFYEARTHRLYCLNATGRAPRLATAEALRSRGLEVVPARGPLSVTVPGAVAGWAAAQERFGSRELFELLAPAVRTAREGIEVTARLTRWIQECRDELSADHTLRRWFFDASNQPLKVGSRLFLPELADSLQRLATVGPDDFYRGRIADAIDGASRAAGGLLRHQDLAEHRCDWVAPVSVSYRGLEVFTTPPNSQGIVALEMLNVFSSLGGKQYRPGTSGHIDALVKAKRAAFADRDHYLSDPAFVCIPLARLLSRRHALRATRRSPEGGRASIGGDTVYCCAVDAQGNACSLIQSLYYAFGAAFVAGDTGIILQNRGHYFSLDENHPNRLEPGKRTLHTLMASMALRKGRPWLVFGTMGADGQPQTTVQVLERALAGAGPQEAVAAPRFLCGRFFIEDDHERLLVEEDLGVETIARLEELGHRVEVAPARDERMGHAQAILVRDEGAIEAGADPRSDGLALVV